MAAAGKMHYQKFHKHLLDLSGEVSPTRDTSQLQGVVEQVRQVAHYIVRY